MAKDLYLIKCAFDNHKQVKHYKSFKTLISVFEQQCVVKEASDKMGCGNLVQIEIRDKPVGEKIISSPHNTDAEYTRKRDQKVVGHKGFLNVSSTISIEMN